MKITIYSTATCPYCKMLKDYLEQKGFVYEEKLVDQDEENRNEMITKSGGYLGVPFTVVKKDNGEEIKIIGFDKVKLEQAIQVEQVGQVAQVAQDGKTY